MQERTSRSVKFRHQLISALLLLTAFAIPGFGANFSFGVLVQAEFTGGLPSTGGSDSVGAGDNASANGASNSSTWQSGQSHALQIEYLKATNTISVKLYQGANATGAFTETDYHPTGGGSQAANAIWTLPASAFFVTAQGGPLQVASASISNLALSGVSGGINILQPLQQTTLTASNIFGSPTSTVTQGQDIIFQGDSNGDWMLTGSLTFSGVALGATPANDLAFGFSGTAAGSSVPETSSLPLVGTGLAALIFFGRRKTLRV
jgi:hypothetical protein